jgi:hypothetical protein
MNDEVVHPSQAIEPHGAAIDGRLRALQVLI